MDLTTNCALCGGVLEPEPWASGLLPLTENDVRVYCACESRTLKGHCGECQSCKVAMHGCACDGAFDAGCFNCTPKEFERPSCPKENFAQAGGSAHGNV